MFRDADSVENDPRPSLMRVNLFFCFTCFFSLSSSPFKCTGCALYYYSIYTTVRTTDCVCVKEAGRVTAALTDQAVLPAGRVTSVVCM